MIQAWCVNFFGPDLAFFMLTILVLFVFAMVVAGTAYILAKGFKNV